MLQSIESVLFFAEDIDAAARWYAEIFGAEVGYENPKFAFIRVAGLLLGFHPADAKCPGGVGGTTVYWNVANLSDAIAFLAARGARLHRGAMTTDLGANVAMLVDPFGNTIGLTEPGIESPAQSQAIDS